MGKYGPAFSMFVPSGTDGEELDLPGVAIVVTVLGTFIIWAIAMILWGIWDHALRTRRRFAREQNQMRMASLISRILSTDEPVPMDGIPTKLRQSIQEARYHCSLSSNVGETTTCRICMEIISTGGNIRALLCGHIFHPACILEWLVLSQSRCPLCGYPLPMSPSSSARYTMSDSYQDSQQEHHVTVLQSSLPSTRQPPPLIVVDAPV